MNSSNAIEILLVEDNPDDMHMTLRALRKANLANLIEVARDGAEALNFVFCEGAHSGRNIQQVPRVILLEAAQIFFCKIVEHQTEGWVRHSMLR